MNDFAHDSNGATAPELAEQKRRVAAYQELQWESERRKREASFARTRRAARWAVMDHEIDAMAAAREAEPIDKAWGAVAASAGLHMTRCPNTHGFNNCPLLYVAVDRHAREFAKPLIDAAWEDGQRDGWQRAMEAEHPPEEDGDA